MPNKGKVAEPGFRGRCVGQRADHHATGLRLPPSVDDRKLPFADHVAIPAPHLGVDRLAYRAEDAQRFAARPLHGLRAFAHEGSQCGGGGIKGGRADIVDDVPIPARVGVGRDRFEHDRGDPVRQRPIDDVAVARDPTDVGRAEVDIIRADVEHVLECGCGVGEVTRRRVNQALGLSGRARGVEDEQRVFGGHPLRGTSDPLLCHRFVQPQITTLLHLDLCLGAFDD